MAVSRRSRTLSWLSLGALGEQRPWLAPLGLGVLTLLLYSASLGHTARFDELYYLLAARGWLAEGEPRIAEGVYDRAPLFTMLIAWCVNLFGESVAVARMPSVIAGALLVVAVFVWTRSVAGSLAAWFAALLLLFWPEGVRVSQFVRFYTLHGLVFWLGAVGVYALAVRRPPLGRWWAGAIAVGAALCFGLALHFQRTTLIGLAGLLLWVGLTVGVPWLWSLPARARMAVIGAGAVLGAIAAGVVVQSGVAADLLGEYRWSPLWIAADRNMFWFYHAEFSLYHPTLWPLFPVAALIGLVFRPKPTAFCLFIFIVALLVHSFAAMKHLRYVYYLMPFLFVIFGIALAHVSQHIYRYLARIVDRLLWLVAPRVPRRLARGGVIGAVLLFAVAASPAFVKAVVTMAGATVPPMRPPADWAAAGEPLEPWLADAAVVVTTSELDALYFFGRHDVLVSKSRLSEIDRMLNSGGAEFSLDPRIGRPVISTPESLSLIMACYSSGLIVTDRYDWRNPAQLDDAVADVVTARTTGPPPAACSALPELGGADAGRMIARRTRQGAPGRTVAHRDGGGPHLRGCTGGCGRVRRRTLPSPPLPD